MFVTSQPSDKFFFSSLKSQINSSQNPCWDFFFDFWFCSLMSYKRVYGKIWSLTRPLPFLVTTKKEDNKFFMINVYSNVEFSGFFFYYYLFCIIKRSLSKWYGVSWIDLTLYTNIDFFRYLWYVLIISTIFGFKKQDKL